MSTWVVDASVLVKSLINEPGNSIAVGIWNADDRFIAPMPAITETAHALLKKVRHEKFPENGALDALKALDQLPVVYLALHPFQATSLFQAARSAGLTAHDCTYLLLAEESDAKLITADVKLLRACSVAPRWKERVLALADWPG